MEISFFAGASRIQCRWDRRQRRCGIAGYIAVSNEPFIKSDHRVVVDVMNRMEDFDCSLREINFQ